MAGGHRRRLKSNNAFQKPGNSVKPPKSEDTGPRLGPIVIGIFIFVVLGSAFVEILRAVTGDGNKLVPDQEQRFNPYKVVEQSGGFDQEATSESVEVETEEDENLD